MSGPKVFNVVTREELIARCEADLRRLDATIAEWTRTCERAGAADSDAAKSILERRGEFRRMLDEGRFADVQKRVPAEISFLRSDAQKRLDRAAAAIAQAAQNRRRTARTARMLLDALKSAGRDIPANLQRDLQSSEVSETAISRAFALLSPLDATGGAATERQREIASELGRGEKRATLADWVATQPNAADSDSDLRIDRHLAELTALGVDPSPFSDRAAAVSAAPPPRQGLLADSLLVDLAKAVTEGRTRASRLAELRERAAELTQHDSAGAQDLRARIAAAVASGDTSSTPALVAEADAFAGEALRAVAADARRRSVLQGLASLGYEVNEGMATAWVQGGQVVLRKAANPGYGIELGGGTKSDRLQVRAVAFGTGASARDPMRDRDMETVWCSEFERLRTLVASAGGGIEIEHALPVGATPLKLIEDTRGEDTESVRAPRTLRT
jgi:hypothetical protein